ncbi:hypothetical protein JHN63_02410 [Streptomyces sp. MBT65]|uniref:hypothetical protein n=1 Tax=Streptomyces sp. MBT65 TaxID=1488395 RepID=UPI00190A84E8|nr:hypothetical protein [Streptomyces sp. MBT65]MBK3572694.1 hypothetical protein [Streptomyces sp. MBT65]
MEFVHDPAGGAFVISADGVQDGQPEPSAEDAYAAVGLQLGVDLVQAMRVATGGATAERGQARCNSLFPWLAGEGVFKEGYGTSRIASCERGEDHDLSAVEHPPAHASMLLDVGQGPSRRPSVVRLRVPSARRTVQGQARSAWRSSGVKVR